MVKNPPAMQEMWVRSLGQEDPLEKEMATHSSILTWKIPWAEEPRGLSFMGWQKSRTQLKQQQLFSTGNYTQYLIISNIAKESGKMSVKLNHFAVHLKITHDCKSTICQ